MARKLDDLDAETRRWMLEELDYDIDNNSLYVSPMLTQRGQREYAALLKKRCNVTTPSGSPRPSARATAWI